MKVTMVGISGSGKTAYMAGLNETLGDTNPTGFRIVPRAGDLSGVLAERGRFESIAFANNNYNWPPGTQKTTLWHFDLRHQITPVTAFKWIDYRGGILDNINKGIVQDDTIELISHITLSNAVILFADAFTITYYKNIKEARRRSGASIIHAIFQAYSDFYPHRDLIFVIALTKCDAVEQKWKEHNYSPLVDRGLEIFETMQELCRLNPSWVGGIVPVSSAGEGTVSRTVEDPEDIQKPLVVKDKFISHPEPINIEHTLFWCVGHTLIQMRKVAQRRMTDRKNEIETTLRGSGLVNEFWSWVTGKPSQSEIAQQLIQEQDEDFNALNQFAPYIDPLYKIAASRVKRI